LNRDEIVSILKTIGTKLKKKTNTMTKLRIFTFSSDM